VAFLEGGDLLTYLHSCVSTKRHAVRVPDPACYLNSYLTDMDVHVGLHEVCLGPVDAPEAVIACLSPVAQQGQPAYPQATYPGILTVLNTLPFEWRSTQRYLPLARDKAAAELRKYVRSHASARKGGVTRLAERLKKEESAIVERVADERSQEASAAQAVVEHGHYSAGYLTFTVVVWDKDREVLLRKAQQVEATLNTEQFICKRETYNTAEAWLGTMPGNTLANVRKPLLHSYNFAHLFPATAMWRGQQWNAHLDGPVLTSGLNRHGAPVGISLHHNDVGHTGIMGTTGDGKSTLLNLFCLMTRRYKRHEVVIFDKEGAAQILTYLVGGTWYDLGKTPLQPLAQVDNAYERSWAVDWLSGLLAMEQVRVSPRIKTSLHEALLELGTWEVHKRTMTNLVGLLEHPVARQGLGLYTHAGPYGIVVDGDTETISSQDWLCFEMGSILESPHLLASVLPAVFHIRERRMRGNPTLFGLHEAWIALDNAYWETRFRAWLKGFRVKNGYLVALNQSLGEAVNAKIMPALLDNIQNWIFTPNDKAEEEEIGKYYRAIGLNTRQREIIRGGTVKRDYYVVTKTGQAMLDFKLGAVTLAACRTWEPDALARYAALYAASPETFAHTYFQEQGIEL
jgi:type IV secretion system protein VirB4